MAYVQARAVVVKDLRRLRRAGIATVVAVGSIACLAAGPTPALASSRTTAHPAVATHRASHAPPVVPRVGVSLPLNRLARFIKTTGSVPGQLSIYQQWATKQPFDTVAASAARKRGMNILVNWEPWAPKCGCPKQPDWTDRKIASGAHDAYIRKYADSVKAFTRTGGHVTIRLAHEMNGNWYPWAAGANGNTPRTYISMWRHVYKVFTAEHVPHVRWMWSPNVEYPGATSMRSLYPGSRYVDDVGLSGYNFGAGHGFHWETFDTLFDPSLKALRATAAHKPLYLAETGCASHGGNKAAWITNLFRQVKKRPYIAGVTWFEQRTQRNWMIEDTPADVRAWKAGIALLRR